jgi:hypothetical protein
LDWARQIFGWKETTTVMIFDLGEAAAAHMREGEQNLTIHKGLLGARIAHLWFNLKTT